MRVDKQHWLYTKQIAHRGLHNAEHPENTMGAFERAMEMGYAIETDVQLTKDNVVVVFHDGDLARATGGADKRVLSDTLYEELQSVRLFGSDEGIPTFAELLQQVNGRVPLLIELKKNNTGGGHALSELTAKLLDGYTGAYAVQSFNPFILKWFKKNRPDMLRGQLSSFFDGSHGMGIRKYVLKHMLYNKSVRPDFISYDLNNLPNPYVDKYVRRFDVPVLAWTVHCPHCLKTVAGHCDNIIFEGFIPPEKLWDKE